MSSVCSNCGKEISPDYVDQGYLLFHCVCGHAWSVDKNGKKLEYDYS